MSLIHQWCSSHNVLFSDPFGLTFYQVHVQRILHTYAKPDIAAEARKLMHRFSQSDLEALIDEAEGHA